MIKKKPIISFCIPTYNRCEYLEKTLIRLNQCIKESKSNEESCSIIISDNCSTDDTRSVVSKYCKILNIKYVLRNKNIGPSSNLIESIKIADGEYIWILSDDDLLDIKSLKMSYNLLMKEKI